MRVSLKKTGLEKASGEALVLTCFQGIPSEEMRCPPIDSLVSSILKSGEFKGKLLQTALIHSKGRHASEHILLIGLGKKHEFEQDIIRQAAAEAVAHLSSLGIKSFSIALPPTLSPEKSAALLAEGAILANYSFTRFKTPEKGEPEKKITEMTILAGDSASQAVERAVIAAESENYARDLANTPPNIAHPSFMAEEAKKLAKECGLKCSIYDEKQLKQMGLNAFLSVSSGSEQPPRLVILEYNAGKGSPVCIIGKGITFDSGGISLKPGEGMDKMKWDKCGACAVLGAMRAASKLKLPLHLIAIAPFTENLPSGKAAKPGDIVRAFDGQTIEILNTDAEGRVILADALAFACKKFKPKSIIDLATLTGAVTIALGSQCAAVLGDRELIEPLKKAGEETHERLWELPLWRDYFDYMKSANADVANISQFKEAGTITGAVFLKKFIPGGIKWAHVDIAGVSYLDRDQAYWRRASATGFGVRLLASFLQNLR